MRVLGFAPPCFRNIKVFCLVSSDLLTDRSTLHYSVYKITSDEIVLSYRVRYTATTLQIDPSKSGGSAASPLASAPDGKTTTDTFSHVKVEETSSKDVTTTFVGSSVVEKSDDRMSTFDAPTYISAMSTDFIMTLKKALCRPVSLATGSWATTDVVGADLKNGVLPEDMLSLTIVSRKLDGFQGIRGSITLRLQATGNPFQQGRLKLLWYPMADEDRSYANRNSPLSWSFWPSVDLDLGMETACELRVPFLLPVSFCDLVTAVSAERPQMGRYMVRVYSPLQVGAGTNTVGWNLYAHWNEDDLQLINPTVNSFQSGKTMPLVEAPDLPASEFADLANVFERLAAHPKALSYAAACLRHIVNSMDSNCSVPNLNARSRLNMLLSQLHTDPSHSTFVNSGSDHLPKWSCNMKALTASATTRAFPTKSEAEESAAQEILNTSPLFRNRAQSGGTKSLVKHGGPPAEKEKKSTSISGALSTGATVLDAASHIPVLAEFAGPTAWALRCAAKVASALGFSRTPIDEVPRLITSYGMPYACNVEGPDVSMPLSLTTQPSLKFEPSLSGKNEDEMALDYFLTKFGYHTVVNLPTSSVAGTNLLSIPLGPFFQSSGEATYPKPYQLLAGLFAYWRGNYRIRIKFVKTKMHTARLIFAFFPGETAAATIADTEYVHREIVDLATVDELTYELPFTSQYPYLTTTSSGRDGVYGTFQIIVVNPLQAPSSVANNINMIIETAWGSGAEFFQPRFRYNSLPVAQSGSTGGLVRVATLSDAKVSSPQIDTAQLCVGEKLMSLRQIIRYAGTLAMTQMYQYAATDATGYIAPFYYNASCIGASSPTGTTSALAGDFLNLIAPYFRYSRGSMRVRGMLKASAPATFSEGTLLTANSTHATGNGLVGTDATPANTPFGGDFNIEANKPFKYTLPAWHSCPIVPHNYVLSNTAPSPLLHRRTQALRIQGYTNLLSTAFSVFLARQPADDYELIGFIGPPAFVTYVSESLKENSHKTDLQTNAMPNGYRRSPSTSDTFN